MRSDRNMRLMASCLIHTFGLVFCVGQSVRAQTEGTWELGRRDTSVSILRSDEDPVTAPHGAPATAWTLALGYGTHAHLEHPVEPTYLIDELDPGVWLKSDRQPLRLRLRVVLPRSADPVSGKPLHTWLDGQAYKRVNEWSRLTVRDLRRVLRRRVRVLRAEHGPHIDADEAYIDRIAVNAHAGPGVVRIWVSPPDLKGNVAVPASRQRPQVSVVSTTGSSVELRPSVEVHGKLWLVHERPFFPRIVDGDATNFNELRQLGWNTVQLSGAPREGDLNQAQRLGLMLIANVPDQNSPELQLHAPDPILAWNVSAGGVESEQLLRQRIDLARNVPMVSRRPILSQQILSRPGWNRFIDAWQHERTLFGTSYPSDQYAVWLQARQDQVASEKPFIAHLSAHMDDGMLRQARRLDQDIQPPVMAGEQFRQILRRALVSGAQGIATRLPDHPEAGAEARNLWESANIELGLLEPWLSAGRERKILKTSRPGIDYLLLDTDRSKITVPLLAMEDGTRIPPTWTREPFDVVIPGVWRASIAYQITHHEVRPLAHRHVAGGMQITLPEFSPGHYILVTRDPLIVTHVRRHLRQSASRRAELAAQRYRSGSALAKALRDQLAPLGDLGAVDSPIATARRLADEGDQHLKRGNLGLAISHYELAENSINRAIQVYWHVGTETLPQPTSSPGGLSPQTLTAHVSLLRQLEHAHVESPLLNAGDMEDLHTLTQEGWQNFQTRQEGIEASVGLARENPRDGSHHLRIQARSAGRHRSHPGSPVWIQTPLVQPKQRALVLVHGWLRISEKLDGQDGFMIFDSLGGPGLALRYFEPCDWKEFAFYRAVDQQETFHVTFALTSAGQVDLDAVTVHRVVP